MAKKTTKKTKKTSKNHLQDLVDSSKAVANDAVRYTRDNVKPIAIGAGITTGVYLLYKTFTQ